MSKWSVVVPSNRWRRFEEFLTAWTPLFKKHEVIVHVVQDSEEGWDVSRWVNSYSHGDIPKFIPRGSDMIRSWGIYQAWLDDSDYTLTLDDDVTPIGDVFDAYERRFEEPAVCSPYFSVGQLTTSKHQMRGFPFADRADARVVIQYGGWRGTLDYDAPTQLVSRPGFEHFKGGSVVIPKGVPVTTCIMNAAWRTEYAPIMWQLPLVDGRYNRFGDIWSGLLQKKILDRDGRAMVINGDASVLHERASNPFANIVREAPGLEINERLWERLSAFDQEPGDTLGDWYRRLLALVADATPAEYGEYLTKTGDCWLGLFDW